MKWSEKVKEVIRKNGRGKPLTEKGEEYVDSTPMDPPIGFKAQPSMFEVMRAMIKAEKLRELEEAGFEGPEDADDFDVDDEFDPSSPYEHNFDHVADPAELQRLRDALNLRERELSTASGRTASSGSAGTDTGSASTPGAATHASKVTPPKGSEPSESAS